MEKRYPLNKSVKLKLFYVNLIKLKYNNQVLRFIILLKFCSQNILWLSRYIAMVNFSGNNGVWLTFL